MGTRSLSINRVRLLSPLTSTSPCEVFIPRWSADYILQNHHLRLRRYMAFRADEIKEVIQQTMEVRVKLCDGYWNNVSDEGYAQDPRGL